jgi:hypothetical protein
VNRWIATSPYEWWGAWEGRLQIVYDFEKKIDVCGHLHESSVKAERCAQELAGRLNSRLRAFDFRSRTSLPSDYYLG